MKFTVYNHKAEPSHKFQHSLINAETNAEAFNRLIFSACGDGMNATFTAKAMETNAALRALPPGGSLRISTQWLDLNLNRRDVDITLTRAD